MTSTLFRLGVRCATHPFRTLGVWLILLLATVCAVAVAGGTPRDNYNIPGTESQAATEFLRAEFPALSGDEARVVLHAPAGALDEGLVASTQDRLHGMTYAGDVSTRWSPDRRTALLSVQYSVPVTTFKGAEAIDRLDAAVAPARAAGVQAEFGGMVAENADTATGGSSELIGLGVAVVVLLAAFGSVLAAGLPLVVALFGLGIGSCLIMLMAAFSDVSTAAPMVASMVGIGVGIDYALLMVTRFTELLRSGRSVPEAAGRTNAEAGSSVVFAGATVMVSLLGLALAGLPVFTSFGYATAAVVLSTVAASLTLVPALCGLAGARLIRRRHRARPEGGRPALSARWAAFVIRRPLALGGVALVALLALAAPATVMRTWPQDAGSSPDSMTTRRAYDLIADAFGPGANAPLLIAVDQATNPGAVQRISAGLRSTPGIATVFPALTDGTAAVIVAEPATGPQDEATSALVRQLRRDVLRGQAQITGTTAVFTDISDKLNGRLWVVIGFVVAVSLVLLTAVFRSVVVAVKAAVMNLLSVAAAFGVLTAVFQWGWGSAALGLPHATSVSTWVPILLFAVLFGLSMDYEVFLLSRIRSAWLRTGDTTASVVEGVGATGRVISAAALIMVSVFVAFSMDPTPVVKMIGIGLATAIAVDATLVRMLLLPATMALLGRANWWIPGWLDRILPDLDPHPVTAGRDDAAPAPERELELAG